MRSVLIGAVEGTDDALRAMQAAGYPPSLLATFDPAIGPSRHVDYVDLAPLCDARTAVRHIDNVNDPAFVAEIVALAPEIIFVIGWSQIVGSQIRAAAKRYTVGFHPTPLPRLRGRAPIAWTILSGAEDSGTSLFLIDGGVDTGAILAQDHFSLSPRETAASLIEKNKISLGRMMMKLLPDLAAGVATAIPQSEENASYGAGRKPEAALIDWSQPAQLIDRLVRAQSAPYAGAFTFTRKRKVTIWSVQPIEHQAHYYGALGQIVRYDEGKPVILCGGNSLLRLDHYTADGRAADFVFSGQICFQNSLSEPV